MTLMLLLICFGSRAQEKVVQYYDSLWARSTPANAMYRTEFIKDGEVYRCYSYWKDSGVLYMRSTFADTVFGKPKEVQVSYYRDGKMKDSAVLDREGLTLRGYIFYPSGKKHAYIHRAPGTKDLVAEGYDESGKQINDFVYMREAAFKGGEEAWKKYIVKKLKKDFYNTKSDETLVLTVRVTFVIDKDGNVSNPKIDKSSGWSDVDGDAISVISGSPKWIPGIYLNEPFNAYRVQPITYELPPSKKKK